jgi:predicted ATPase
VVLGREFDFDLLSAFWARGEEAALEALDDLLRHRLVDEGSGALRRDYAFTHHKIHEVVYAGIPRRRRQHLHAQAGVAIESLYGTEIEELAGELAFHFQQGQQVDKALTGKAIAYLHQAGERAMRLSAYEEAITHFTQGLALIETLPDFPKRAGQELSLQLALGVALQATKGYATPEVGHAYARAWELCQQMGETPQLFQALRLLGSYYGSRGEFQISREIGELLLSLAEQVQVPILTVVAHFMLGWSLLFLGELVQAREHLEWAIASYDPQQHQAVAFSYGFEHRVACLSFASWALWTLGHPDQALKRSQEALALAQELAHPLSQAFAQSCAALFHGYRRDVQPAQELAEACIDISTKHSFPFWKASVISLRGWALFERGQAEAGLAQMRQGIAAYQATGTEMGRPHQLASLAEACGKTGRVKEGLAALTEALSVVNRTKERLFEAEVHRVKGELLRAQGTDEAEVERVYRQAIEVARQQQARSWELRATMSLCRLWQGQGKREEAQQMLAEIYGWFTEGFDTPDLKEAKVLLEELD